MFSCLAIVFNMQGQLMYVSCDHYCVFIYVFRMDSWIYRHKWLVCVMLYLTVLLLVGLYHSNDHMIRTSADLAC